MRYVMRIAELVNHQIFERIWRAPVAHACFSVSSSHIRLRLFVVYEPHGALCAPRGLKCGQRPWCSGLTLSHRGAVQRGVVGSPRGIL